MELELQKSDLDSYYKCPSCNKDDFTGRLKTKQAKKQQITRIVY